MDNSASKAEPVIRRTTLSNSGVITEHDIPISSIKKEAMSISDDPKQSLLLTREAAVRITEHAITNAIAKSWSNLVEEANKKAITTLPDIEKPQTTTDDHVPSPISKQIRDKDANISRTTKNANNRNPHKIRDTKSSPRVASLKPKSPSAEKRSNDHKPSHILTNILNVSHPKTVKKSPTPSSSQKGKKPGTTSSAQAQQTERSKSDAKINKKSSSKNVTQDRTGKSEQQRKDKEAQRDDKIN